MASNATELSELGLGLLFYDSHVIGILPQLTVYGIYTTLFTISTYMMVKQGLDSRSRKYLFWMTVFMYTLTTLYTGASIANLIQIFQQSFFQGFSTAPVNLPIFSALFLINYSLTDGVVVWRAWVLCRNDSRAGLYVSLFFLCCAFLSETATIVIRIALTATPASNTTINAHLTRAIGITQVANLALSLLTNLTATTTVSLKAWRLRSMFFSGPSQPKTGKVLVLIVESGVLYSISLITVLIATVIPLPLGTLGDLYTPVNCQLAGIYPLIVLIMVNKERTLDKAVTAFSSNNSGIAMSSLNSKGQTESTGSNTMITESTFRGKSSFGV